MDTVGLKSMELDILGRAKFMHRFCSSSVVVTGEKMSCMLTVISLHPTLEKISRSLTRQFFNFKDLLCLGVRRAWCISEHEDVPLISVDNLEQPLESCVHCVGVVIRLAV